MTYLPSRPTVPVTIRGPIAATSDTLVPNDAGTIILYSSSAPVSVTAIDFGYGKSVQLCQFGTGQVTVVPGATTLVSDKSPAAYATMQQYAVLTLFGTGMGTAIVTGNTAAVSTAMTADNTTLTADSNLITADAA